MRAGVPGPYAANGVRGQRWRGGGSSSKTLTNHVDAAHAEIWLRDRSLAADQWPTATSWKQDADMVAQAEAEGRVVMVETKLWRPPRRRSSTGGGRSPSGRSCSGPQDARPGSSSRPPAPFAGMTVAHPWDDVPVGSPLGPYSRQGTGGAYVRGFTSGFVAVNPGRP